MCSLRRRRSAHETPWRKAPERTRSIPRAKAAQCARAAIAPTHVEHEERRSTKSEEGRLHDYQARGAAAAAAAESASNTPLRASCSAMRAWNPTTQLMNASSLSQLMKGAISMCLNMQSACNQHAIRTRTSSVALRRAQSRSVALCRTMSHSVDAAPHQLRLAHEGGNQQAKRQAISMHYVAPSEACPACQT